MAKAQKETTLLQDVTAALAKVDEQSATTDPHMLHVKRGLETVVELLTEKENGVDLSDNSTDGLRSKADQLQEQVINLSTDNQHLNEAIEVYKDNENKRIAEAQNPDEVPTKLAPPIEEQTVAPKGKEGNRPGASKAANK